MEGKSTKKLDVWKGGTLSIGGRTIFWQGGCSKKKYYLVKWSKICKSKKKGGLGIKNLRKLNLSLLSKSWWKFENEEGL